MQKVKVEKISMVNLKCFTFHISHCNQQKGSSALVPNISIFWINSGKVVA